VGAVLLSVSKEENIYVAVWCRCTPEIFSRKKTHSIYRVLELIWEYIFLKDFFSYGTFESIHFLKN
jgi:hypothetical protein